MNICQQISGNSSQTRVILDATETPIQKPSRVDDQSVTFSIYKNKNTFKTIIGCSPHGLVTYVSDSYGGSASDRQIIERLELCRSAGMCHRGDSIMSDRNHVNTPSMLKGKSQLDAETVVRDRRIASKRIDLPHQKISLGGRIVKVCFMISNFRRAIVSRNA